jgi:hypothetical protein
MTRREKYGVLMQNKCIDQFLYFRQNSGTYNEASNEEYNT